MMQAKDLQSWLISSDGLASEFETLRAWSAGQSLGEDVITLTPQLSEFKPDWKRLLLAASFLAESGEIDEQEIALMTAQAAMLFGPNILIRDAGAVILSQLANNRSIDLAAQRNHIAPDLEGRLGICETLLATRRIIEATIVLNDARSISGNPFQTELWEKLRQARWASATAPTAAGKTYLVLNWLLSEFERGICELVIFLAPTRALVSEIENELLTLKKEFNVPNLRVGSIPLRDFADRSAPTIVVFTQERLHLFFNACEMAPKVDITVVDEVQKLGDGTRGVILQDAIERVISANGDGRFVFLSPHAENPSKLIEDAPENVETAIVPGGPPTVTQNLMLAKQIPYRPTEWTLSLAHADYQAEIGHFKLHDRPSGKGGNKRLSFIGLAFGRNDKGTLIYANEQSEAEKFAQQIYDALGNEDGGPLDEELEDLSNFCKTSIHNRFKLVHLVKRGVAFHYGNMPSLLRSEIERLFKTGKIRFLVCTSTLIEGVNLACRNIIVRVTFPPPGIPAKSS
ncbi:DEAD/DEAH box helicase [Desulfolutivibrio sulfoxidireducens]|uniref:DEAD/DEAH box helicase n=1 Tax=Desulfolutivibrio sulfoxidireducens TaxID=2773299 RepID=UPI00159E44F4|nr:DEAD/DEAH box helicase [Desulfolutivibrio sulfoxidireducens]QLA16666.1 DEAD/DEAH box helicase [Desulfolutivibrio sulfoxidireducens]